jgi:hypothetical protein
MICFGSFVAGVLLLILWAAVIAPRRARRLFAGLEADGWRPPSSGDEELRTLLEALPPIDVTGSMSDRGTPPRSTVESARVRSSPSGSRYLIQFRVHSVDSADEEVLSFSTAVLESRPHACVGSAVHVVARQQESRIDRPAQILGLRRVEVGLDPGFAGLFLVLASLDSERLPSALQQALLASAALFVRSAGGGGYVPRVSLRLSPSGWALVVPEPIVMAVQMRALLTAAQRVSEALSPAS